MRPVYLVGFMGVGKTTVGKRLASHMELDFIDLDLMFENKYKLTVQAFFAKYGEPLFRKFEYDLLRSTLTMKNVVVSTGGGTSCYGRAMSDMLNNGLVLYLSMPAKALMNRLVNAKRQRPLLEGKTTSELYSFIKNKLPERDLYYTQAHFTVDALRIDMDYIIEKIKALALKNI